MELGAPNKILRMKRIRPNRCRAISVIGVLAVVCGSGCHNQQTALSNPFMAPDRVPPPATRVVAPGAAQPYYPGDPLPAAHASATPPAPAITAATAPAPIIAQPVSPPTALAFGNERTVAVPADDSSLRFALPSPPVDSQAAASASPPTVAPAPPSMKLAAQPTTSPVIPASYVGSAPNGTAPTSVADVSPASPWRSPQIPSPAINATPTVAASNAPKLAAPVAGPMIPVTLRAVSSPAADVASQPPRIRFPSYDAAPQEAMAPNGNPVQQAAFAAPSSGIARQPGPQQGLPQTLPITELPSSAAVPGLGPAAMPSISVATQPQLPAVVSPDGFRPRSAMR
jgi:hypothetical protein